MKLVLSPELLGVTDYRDFLRKFYEINKGLSSKFSYSFLAKRCHFSSKSFLKDVIDGKKRLSIESTQKIIDGLDMPATWGQYFYNLVSSTESFPQKTNAIEELARVREKLSRQKGNTTAEQEDGLFRDRNWPFVYAALGDPKVGSTFAEIQARTQMAERDIQQTLENLLNENLVVRRGARYFATKNSFFFENMKNSEFFKEFYMKSLDRLYRQARSHFHSQNQLYFNMALSVDPNKMEAFKKSLSELLDEYTEKIEKPDGKRVALLTCGFHLI